MKLFELDWTGESLFVFTNEFIFTLSQYFSFSVIFKSFNLHTIKLGDIQLNFNTIIDSLHMLHSAGLQISNTTHPSSFGSLL